MSKDVIAHCRSCKVCQAKSKVKPPKAPIVERPVLSEPFEQVAIDIVGPLPVAKGGYRFMLTYICLATKWPEAIPLKRITAKSVAEGLWQIFSRTSIPEVILSDQGKQFHSSLLDQLSELIQVAKVRTSPYHPQCNGVVERMHGTLGAVLSKCVEEKRDWAVQLPFALFILREMPNADLGFSPFDLVYGFRIRTPMDGLFECEVNGCCR